MVKVILDGDCGVADDFIFELLVVNAIQCIMNILGYALDCTFEDSVLLFGVFVLRLLLVALEI